jgi:hypothetical protein
VYHPSWQETKECTAAHNISHGVIYVELVRGGHVHVDHKLTNRLGKVHCFGGVVEVDECARNTVVVSASCELKFYDFLEPRLCLTPKLEYNN